MSECPAHTNTTGEHIMSNASDYADSLLADINRRADAGAPFGWRNLDDDEWTGDIPVGYLDDEDSTWTEASAFDFISDALDIQYIVSGDRTYHAARVCIAFGGPTAWIDTRTETLDVQWWSSAEVRDLPKAFIDGLDDALSELWDM